MQLYTYFRSSAAYRVRIALQLKGLEVEAIPVHLIHNGGEQHSEEYHAINPAGLVPTLVDTPHIITQSLAICEYLEEKYPHPPLLPHDDPVARARVRALALSVACETHPLNNLRVLNYLTGRLGISDDEKKEWIEHWMHTGLAAEEALLAEHPATGRFCHGDAPGLADLCLIPQLFNARRFHLALDAYPTLQRIEETCSSHPAFIAAAPANQPDAH